jgi:protein-tyrosine-phosphatase
MATILLVCTGNICRSPIAEGFLRQMLAERGIDGVEVASAGVSGLDGYPAVPEAVDALVERNVDISSHLARRLNRRMAESADLVIAMASGHRDALTRLAPASARRTFTLKELVYLLERLDEMPGQNRPDERMAAAVWAAASLRDQGATRDLTDEDIPDPLGLGPEAFRGVAWQLESLVDRAVEGLFGPAANGGPIGLASDESLRRDSSSTAPVEEGRGFR